MRDDSIPSVTACADGPLLVRGSISLIADDGTPIPTTRRTVALCRCGASAIKPWCDGTHKLIRFTTSDSPRPRTAEPGGERSEGGVDRTPGTTERRGS
jgi:CDGSH-type Zn-finger protein